MVIDGGLAILHLFLLGVEIGFFNDSACATGKMLLMPATCGIKKIVRDDRIFLRMIYRQPVAPETR